MNVQAPKVLVFGEALVDVFGAREVAGGAPFNVACHLAGLGIGTALLTRVGNDPAAAQLHAIAERFGVDWRWVQVDTERPTGRVLVHPECDGHRFEILPQQAYDAIAAPPAQCEQLHVAAPDWLYHGTLALREAGVREALRGLREAVPGRRFVDLNWREAGPSPQRILELVADADVLKLNDEELRMVLAWLGRDVAVPSLPRAGARDADVAWLMQELGVSRLLVTYGAAGAAAWGTQGVCDVVAPVTASTPVVDTVGAGDAFAARMLAALASGESLDVALPQAVAFAGAVCGVRGGVPDDPAFHAAWRVAASS